MRTCLLLLLALAAPAAAQVPATDIFVATLKVAKGPGGTAQWQVGAPVNVTHRPGYDNQPAFLPGGRSFLYTVIGDDAQADIYRYDLAAGKSTRLTTTTESEYSPTPLPQGRGFSVVRVEPDSTQRLWAFDLDGSHPRLLLPGVKPVGYHAWIDSVTVAVFVLGSPATLQLADLRTGKPRRDGSPSWTPPAARRTPSRRCPTAPTFTPGRRTARCSRARGHACCAGIPRRRIGWRSPISPRRA